jgi:hypothetical protein
VDENPFEVQMFLMPRDPTVLAAGSSASTFALTGDHADMGMKALGKTHCAVLVQLDV